VSITGTSFEFRVSFVPVTWGESIVLRIFNTKQDSGGLDSLGFSDTQLSFLKKALRIPDGLILATGPTGSGKTTTLHALLCSMDTEQLKIITIEDPVERILSGINQIQVNDDIQLSFGTMLRRVLRQDPDVIMVGEIRDTMTAELAMRAALTGHVILSTLHTNDSVSAITRLTDMGIEPYLTASVLRYSLAQRLVRKVCPFCAQTVPVTEELSVLQKKYDIHHTEMKRACGCEKCGHTGYHGRVAVAEIFETDSRIERMISESRTAAEIKSYARSQGMKTLAEDAVLKVCSGITTLEEIKREALV